MPNPNANANSKPETNFHSPFTPFRIQNKVIRAKIFIRLFFNFFIMFYASCVQFCRPFSLFSSFMPLFLFDFTLLFDYFLLLSRNIQLSLTSRFVTDISLFFSIKFFFDIVWNIEIYFKPNPNHGAKNQKKKTNPKSFSLVMVLIFWTAL